MEPPATIYTGPFLPGGSVTAVGMPGLRAFSRDSPGLPAVLPGCLGRWSYFCTASPACHHQSAVSSTCLGRLGLTAACLPFLCRGACCLPAIFAGCSPATAVGLLEGFPACLGCGARCHHLGAACCSRAPLTCDYHRHCQVFTTLGVPACWVPLLLHLGAGDGVPALPGWTPAADTCRFCTPITIVTGVYRTYLEDIPAVLGSFWVLPGCSTITWDCTGFCLGSPDFPACTACLPRWVLGWVLP